MLYLYTLIISIFFSGLFYYMVDNVLVPYGEDNVISVKNFIIVSILFLCAFTSIFTLIHSALDKFFFRKFYQGPRIFLAVRRGVLLGLMLVSFAWMRVFDFWQIHIVLLSVSLALLLEALFMSVGANVGSEEVEEKKELS